MDLRRPTDFTPLRSSPHMDHEPAPSPDSVAASPMLISSRNSECGDAIFESDEGYGISEGDNSRRSTLSRADMQEATRDLDFRSRYPELHSMMRNRSSSADGRSADGRSAEGMPAPPPPPEDPREALFKETCDIYKRLRRQERQMRDMQKNYDNLQNTNRQIRETYVKIYAKAEQEEEYISNILLKRIQKLKNDKESLAQKYEQEEEFLTNELMRKIQQLTSERDNLEGKVKSEQAVIVDNLLCTIRRMESEMAAGRKNMERMRKEKIDQENALEHEQELLFNTLGKQMDQLNTDKRKMQASLQKAYLSGYIEQAVDVSPSPEPNVYVPLDTAVRGSANEVTKLRSQLKRAESHISELRDRDANKAAQIRHMEEILNNVLKEKNDMSRSIEEALNKYSVKLESVSAPMLRSEMSMGPPSVPATPRAVDYVSDMDDSSSRGSLSQSDFPMNQE